MHDEARRGYARMLTQAVCQLDFDTQGQFSALDIGGRDNNGNCRDLFPESKWTVLDAEDGPDVDVIADAREWISPGQFDIISTTEVFEHVPQWQRIIAAAKSSLDPNGLGLFIGTAAAPPRPEHGALGGDRSEGEHYGNVAPYMLALFLHDNFSKYGIEYQTDPGDVYWWAAL